MPKSKNKGTHSLEAEKPNTAALPSLVPLSTFPIVALGASAGGLEALQRFFAVMPAQSGMAFVVVTHQKLGSVSLLPELIQGRTDIRVVSAKDGLVIEADHIYIAPSTGCLSLTGFNFNTLLDELVSENFDIYHPIDYFFRSLAKNFNTKAICIVMSGSGSDGTIGLQAINECGGLVIAEDPLEAAFAGMPASAIATGLVDFVLTPEQMPEALIQYSSALKQQKNSTENKNNLIPDIILKKIFNLLRKKTGHDFSAYKTSTLFRRIERRMSIHQIVNPEKYVTFLESDPQEIDLLFKELLIRVTHFFRDSELWESLNKAPLLSLLSACQDDEIFRVWVPGCATGEEAYSLAILIRECMDKLNKNLDVQIFATDLDASAIDIARKGLFSDGIAADVSSKRLKKYFVYKNDQYTIRSDIREMMVFAAQNLIRDPPFTNVNLISCRNLLIYMKSDLQKQVLSIFHYALKAKGLLILGPSETIGEFSAWFETLDKKNKIFRHKQTDLKYVIPDLPYRKLQSDTIKIKDEKLDLSKIKHSFSFSVLKMLVSRFAPVCIIINYLGEIHYIHGKTGHVLELGEGRPRTNIIDMAREGLRLELTSAMRAIANDTLRSVKKTIKISHKKSDEFIDFTLERIERAETLNGLLLITLTPIENQSDLPTEKSTDHHVPVYPEDKTSYENELRIAQESYQTLVEELESSNEELKSTNEELQSTNEELQSTNEELETSKEELQSLNEELSTVNAELQSKLDELSQTNNDMQNLLNSTDIATIFLDERLCIKRFTDPASQLISLRPSDINRPIIELASNLQYDGLIDDAQDVLKTLKPKEVTLQTNMGSWYLMRMLPYRTIDNIIEGLVCTFIDIEKIKQAERQSTYFKGIVEALVDPLIVLDDKLLVCTANKALYSLLQLKPKQVEGKYLYDIDRGAWNVPELHDALSELQVSGTQFEQTEIKIDFFSSGSKKLLLNGRALGSADTTDKLILITITDLTDA